MTAKKTLPMEKTTTTTIIILIIILIIITQPGTINPLLKK